MLYALGCITGATLTAMNLRKNPDQRLAGGMGGTGALLGYNLYRNPQWFRIFMNPLLIAPLFVLYSVFYNDRAALGGFSAGYLAFLFGLV